VSDYDQHLPAIAAGDADAFGCWLAGCELRLRSSLASFAAHVDTEAVLQESLLRVWQVAPRFESDGKPNSLLRFAIRVTRNCAISELRRLRAGTTREVALVEHSPAYEEPTEPDPQLRELIRQCRDKLPSQPALVLAARLDGDIAKPDRELAAALGMTLNTFLQNFGRARKLLARCLERGGVALEAVLS